MTYTSFSLTPEQIFLGFLYIQSPAGRNIYQAATKPLSSSGKFDLEAHGIYSVLKEYPYCGDDNGCTNAVSDTNIIPDGIQGPSTEYKNLST